MSGSSRRRASKRLRSTTSAVSLADLISCSLIEPGDVLKLSVAGFGPGAEQEVAEAEVAREGWLKQGDSVFPDVTSFASNVRGRIKKKRKAAGESVTSQARNAKVNLSLPADWDIATVDGKPLPELLEKLFVMRRYSPAKRVKRQMTSPERRGQGRALFADTVGPSDTIADDDEDDFKQINPPKGSGSTGSSGMAFPPQSLVPTPSATSLASPSAGTSQSQRDSSMSEYALLSLDEEDSVDAGHGGLSPLKERAGTTQKSPPQTADMLSLHGSSLQRLDTEDLARQNAKLRAAHRKRLRDGEDASAKSEASTSPSAWTTAVRKTGTSDTGPMSQKPAASTKKRPTPKRSASDPSKLKQRKLDVFLTKGGVTAPKTEAKASGARVEEKAKERAPAIELDLESQCVSSDSRRQPDVNLLTLGDEGSALFEEIPDESLPLLPSLSQDDTEANLMLGGGKSTVEKPSVPPLYRSIKDDKQEDAEDDFELPLPAEPSDPLSSDDEAGATSGSLPDAQDCQTILGSGLTPHMVNKISLLSKRVGGKFVKRFNSEVSVLVVYCDSKGTPKTTVKLHQAIAAGLPVVSYDWVLESFQKLSWVDVTKYLVLSLPGIARSVAAAKKGEPRLFAPYRFCLLGAYDSPSKPDLETIVRAGGGTLLPELPKLPTTVQEELDQESVFVLCHPDMAEDEAAEIYFKCGVHPLAVHYILDCICHYAILDTKAYRFIDDNEDEDVPMSLAF